MKTQDPTLKDWQFHNLMLTQALLGSISNNVRMVTLVWSNDCWVIETVLDHECAEDREEMQYVAEDTLTYIEDVRDQISASSYRKIVSQCTVSQDVLLIENRKNRWPIFKKKEV